MISVFLGLFSGFFFSPSYAATPTPGTEILLKDFIALTEGKYDIKKADGKAPKLENKDASVEKVDDELTMVFPYCPPGSGLCDPGWIFFPIPPATGTTVYKQDLKNKNVLYTLFLEDGSDTFQFEWETPNNAKDNTIFRRLNYSYSGGKPFTLAFEIQKKKIP